MCKSCSFDQCLYLHIFFFREPEYYDYGHGETQEGYENYGKFSFLVI